MLDLETLRNWFQPAEIDEGHRFGRPQLRHSSPAIGAGEPGAAWNEWDPADGDPFFTTDLALPTTAHQRKAATAHAAVGTAGPCRCRAVRPTAAQRLLARDGVMKALTCVSLCTTRPPNCRDSGWRSRKVNHGRVDFVLTLRLAPTPRRLASRSRRPRRHGRAARMKTSPATTSSSVPSSMAT
jgi:hypothetical protein